MDLKRLSLIAIGAVVSALGAWVIMNWIPSTTILIASVAGGYIAYKKTE